MRDGSSVLDLFPKQQQQQQQQPGSDKVQQGHRSHKLFAPVVLLMLKEVG